MQDALAKASEEVSRKEASYTASAANIEKIQTARSALFGGKATSQIQAELSGAITSAKSKLAEQVELMQQCTNGQTRHQEARDQASKRLAEQMQYAETAAATLATWLNKFNCNNSSTPIDTEQLCILLAHTVEWIGDERK